jgi:hypothetical protein
MHGAGGTPALAQATTRAARRSAVLRHQRSHARPAVVQRRRTSRTAQHGRRSGRTPTLCAAPAPPRSRRRDGTRRSSAQSLPGARYCRDRPRSRVDQGRRRPRVQRSPIRLDLLLGTGEGESRLKPVWCLAGNASWCSGHDTCGASQPTVMSAAWCAHPEAPSVHRARHRRPLSAGGGRRQAGRRRSPLARGPWPSDGPTPSRPARRRAPPRCRRTAGGPPLAVPRRGPRRAIARGGRAGRR